MRVIIAGAGPPASPSPGASPPRRHALVLDRGAPGAWFPRPFMPPYHGFDALAHAGVVDVVRAVSWEIAPRPGAGPVALATPFLRFIEILAEGVEVRHGQEVTGLLRDGDGRVTGVRARDHAGERDEAADLVVACDGIRSPLRGMDGIGARLELAEGAHMSFISPAEVDRSFALHYQADGRQVGLLGWPGGSAGWWDSTPTAGGSRAWC